MANVAITDRFMLGTADVMIGPVADLHKLNMEEHCVGLVKNFTTEGQKEYTELTAGIRNDIVDSVVTGAPVSGSFEMYEYTPRNMAYAMSLDPGAATNDPEADTVADDGNTTAIDFAADVSTFTTSSVTVTLGQTVLIQHLDAMGDVKDAYLGKVAEAATASELKVHGDFSGITIGAGEKIQIFTPDVMDLGKDTESEEYAMKVQGELEDGSLVLIEYPKIRVTSGFSLAFTTDAHGNMPFQFDVMKLIKQDALYEEFKDKKAHLTVLKTA